jgi:hypothetical protein
MFVDAKEGVNEPLFSVIEVERIVYFSNDGLIPWDECTGRPFAIGFRFDHLNGEDLGAVTIANSQQIENLQGELNRARFSR